MIGLRHCLSFRCGYALLHWLVKGWMSSRVPNKHSNAAAPASSVLFRQHDRDHAFSDRGIRGIGRVVGKRLVVVVDSEEDPVAVRIECAKVMLFVRIVGVTKVI